MVMADVAELLRSLGQSKDATEYATKYRELLDASEAEDSEELRSFVDQMVGEQTLAGRPPPGSPQLPDTGVDAAPLSWLQKVDALRTRAQELFKREAVGYYAGLPWNALPHDIQTEWMRKAEAQASHLRVSKDARASGVLVATENGYGIYRIGTVFSVEGTERAQFFQSLEEAKSFARGQPAKDAADVWTEEKLKGKPDSLLRNIAKYLGVKMDQPRESLIAAIVGASEATASSYAPPYGAHDDGAPPNQHHGEEEPEAIDIASLKQLGKEMSEHTATLSTLKEHMRHHGYNRIQEVWIIEGWKEQRKEEMEAAQAEQMQLEAEQGSERADLQLKHTTEQGELRQPEPPPETEEQPGTPTKMGKKIIIHNQLASRAGSPAMSKPQQTRVGDADRLPSGYTIEYGTGHNEGYVIMRAGRQLNLGPYKTKAEAVAAARREAGTSDAPSSASFEQWMARVDGAVQARSGVSVHDLPDCPFRDWYDRGIAPTVAASRCIARAK